MKNFNLLLIAFIVMFGTTSHSALSPSAPQWSGDMRLRGAHQKEAVDDDRYYSQIRARLLGTMTVNENVSAYLRLATATSAVSTNQTIGDSSAPGMARRNFGVDQAYADWRVVTAETSDAEPLNGSVWIGRMPTPFFSAAKSQIIFDSDLAFEGLATRWTLKGSDVKTFLNAGAFMISENYTAPNDAVDSAVFGLNIGTTLSLGEFGNLTVHASRYHWANIADRNITTIENGARTDSYSLPFLRSKGNSVYASGGNNYFRSGFVQTEFGFELKSKLDPIVLTVFADGVVNEVADTGREALETGVSAIWGRATLAAAWISRRADSVVGAFTDSDTNGGGSDNRGTRVSLAYQLSDQTMVSLTDYRAKRGIDSTEREYQLQQLDFVLNF